MRKLPLRLVHCSECHAIPRKRLGRNEVPTKVLLGLERVGGQFPLLGVQRLEETRGRRGHPGRRGRRPLRRRDDGTKNGQDYGNECETGRDKTLHGSPFMNFDSRGAMLAPAAGYLCGKRES
jgi:hypothetical protein